MIPKEIKDDVDKITDEIINYQNINNYSKNNELAG